MKITALDDYADGLPENGTLIVVTSTYNGKAPDSATRFETAIAEKQIGEIERPNLTYAVLGCGNTQWQTYQAFPKLMEATLRQTGAKNVAAARRSRWQRRFRRRRRTMDGRAVDRRWAKATRPRQRPRPRLKITFSDAHATRPAVLPEQAYRAAGASATTSWCATRPACGISARKPRAPRRGT